MVTVTQVTRRSPLNPKITTLLELVVEMGQKAKYKDDIYLNYLANAAQEALTEVIVQAAEKECER